MEPIIKWAGGKRLLTEELRKLIDLKKIEANHNRYYEPFVGGGALFFNLEYKNSVINDCNSELINAYIVVRDFPDKLIKKLTNYRDKYNDDFFDDIRQMDRKKNFKKLSPVTRAARFIFLNKTCNNGLYRVNSQGFFNVPNGRYQKPDIVNKDKIKKASEFLKKDGIVIRNMDFEEAVSDAIKGDIVYFDPPYDYDANGFTSYIPNGFDRADLEKLHRLCEDLISRGCEVIVSNNDTDFVKGLFKETHYIIHHIEANRFINCDGKKRKKVKEVIIYGKQ